MPDAPEPQAEQTAPADAAPDQLSDPAKPQGTTTQDAAANTWAETVRSFRWPVAVVLLTLIGYAIYSRTLDTGERVARYAPDTARHVVKGLVTIAEKFKTGKITTTFVAAIPELTPLANLEVAKVDVVETFSREDEKRILWDYVSLGKTVSQIKTSVTYRYHIPLQASWKLQVSGQTCVVEAPAIQPSLPPAIHTNTMEKRTQEGWLRFNGTEQMEALQKTLTPVLSQYARDPRHLGLVREDCRKAVAEFVRSWLLREDHWRTDRFRAIKVRFADEPEETAPAPVLELEGEDGRSH